MFRIAYHCEDTMFRLAIDSRDNQIRMKIDGPERYKLTFDADKFVVTCSRGTPKFSGLSTRRLPKLYVVSFNAKLIYVGITRQPMRSRFRGGWTADGENGYHGYAWRKTYTEAVLDIWCHEDAPLQNSDRDMETIEAEVVYLARREGGQWPEGQTEIHFHPSSAQHRQIAETIWLAVTRGYPV